MLCNGVLKMKVVEVLKKKEKVNVIPTGLWLSTNSLLRASPDGLVNTDYFVEVKCS